MTGNSFLDFIFTLLSQIAGGPGPKENNLVRFGLPALMWALLLIFAWNRQRQEDLPREKWLVWGFGLGFLRELFMFSHVAMQLLLPSESSGEYFAAEPLEHAISMAAIITIAAAFLRYILDKPRIARHYLYTGLVTCLVLFLVTLVWWGSILAADPAAHFEQSWSAWPFHVAGMAFMALGIFYLSRRRGWLSQVVSVALLFSFLAESKVMFNFYTNFQARDVICPVGNTFHLLVIPLLAYVYLREQSIEKKQAEDALAAYRFHLEELVAERTTELTTTNQELEREAAVRSQAERAYQSLSHRFELVLNSAGEGIVVMNDRGEHTFVNPAAARMLGYQPDELIGRSSHALWHHSLADGTPYPEDDCPFYAQFKSGGALRYGSDQIFWRKDGVSFPVEYVSSPIQENDKVVAVVGIFKDITDRKQTEKQIARRNAELAAQNAISGTISQSLDLETIMKTSLDTVLQVFGFDFGAIYLLDPDGESLTLQIYRGRSAVEELVASAHQLRLGEGSSDQAVTEMRPVVLDVSDPTIPFSHPFLESEGIQTLASTPLVTKGHAIGMLTLGARQADALADADLSLLAAIGQQIGIAVENAYLYQETGRRAEELALLHQASVFLTSSLDPQTIYAQVTQQAVQLLDCQVSAIFRWDQRQQEAVGVSAYGIPDEVIHSLRVKPGDGELMLPAISPGRRSISISDASLDPHLSSFWQEKFNMRALLALPVWGKARPLGFIFIIDQEKPRRWLPQEIELAESLANLASIALENAILHQQVERAAALEERQRIAADMHDGLAQTLSYLGHKMDQLIETTDPADSDPTPAAELHHLRETINEATREVRLTIASLQKSPAPPQSLQAMLADSVSDFGRDSDTQAQWLDSTQEAIMLPADCAEQVQRIVQEALLNAARHAEAGHIQICLDVRPDEFEIRIQDDGKGFDPQAPPLDQRQRFGLSIMRARAARIGGRVRIDASPGRGTQVILTCPREVTLAPTGLLDAVA